MSKKINYWLLDLCLPVMILLSVFPNGLKNEGYVRQLRKLVSLENFRNLEYGINFFGGKC